MKKPPIPTAKRRPERRDGRSRNGGSEGWFFLEKRDSRVGGQLEGLLDNRVEGEDGGRSGEDSGEEGEEVRKALGRGTRVQVGTVLDERDWGAHGAVEEAGEDCRDEETAKSIGGNARKSLT